VSWDRAEAKVSSGVTLWWRPNRSLTDNTKGPYVLSGHLYFYSWESKAIPLWLLFCILLPASRCLLAGFPESWANNGHSLSVLLFAGWLTLFVWDRVFLCSPGWPRTHGPVPSASLVLGWQSSATTSYVPHTWSEPLPQFPKLTLVSSNPGQDHLPW
jgi:hypothetical protein